MTTAPPPADDGFWRGLESHLADSGGPILMIERWARGAGRRSWFLLTGSSDVRAAREAVRAGSSLTTYFRPHLPIQGKWSPPIQDATQALLDGLGPNEELVALVDRGGRPLLEADYLSDWGDVERFGMEAGRQTVWIGKYPDWPPDGELALTRVVPDADGIARPYPY